MLPPSLSLLCLPCAGGSATMYMRWRRRLPEWIRLVPVELPGRGGRMDEPFESDFRRLIQRLCDEQASAMSGAYALFGHSMGALLAHALAQEQRTRGGVLPRALFAAGSGAPSTFDANRFAKHDDAALIADLKKQGGTPDGVFADRELLRIALDSLGSDYRLCDSFSYLPAPPMSCALHVFAGRADELGAERLEAWRREAVGPFSVDWFDGGHFFVRQQEAPMLTLIVQKLSARLAIAAHDPVTT